ncbi:MAG: ATP synthase F1 subunit delta [Candidatus Brocadiales bacterium]|nr:ATP synthase F1 subunit delta [Candidatus Bathyanammoxibius sp.]MCQ4573957.1 ATP synthase F1 subunit delta [Candidatus Bathyanammoxibius amoris]
MIDKTLATGYLQALFELAKSKGQLQEAANNLETVSRLFRENADLKKILLHPSVTRDEKARLVKSVFAPYISPLVRNFLLLIVSKRRESILSDLLEEYQAVADLVGGRSRAVIRTAIPLTEEKHARLKKALEDMAQKEVEIETQVAPEILGGVVVRIGNRVIDGSVASRLKNLRRRLVEVGIS